ncbi:hypothetical protein ACHAO5_004464 [Verticillium nonalfalfae]
MHASALLALPLLPAAMAAYGSSSGATPAAAQAAAASSGASIPGVHVVKVGENGLTFEPAEVTAAVGDVVEFHFWPQAHSVAQSSFDSPCQPLNTTGFFSGPVRVQSGVSDQVFSVTVQDTNPKWYYCATGQHCQNGMVGVINAPANNNQRTLQAYSQAAANAQSNVAPSSTGGGSLGAAATAAPSSASGSASPSSSSAPSAGMEAHGEIRWGMLTMGVAVAGFIGGLMI